MDTQQALSHIEKLAVVDRLTYAAVLSSLLREVAGTQSDSGTFLAKVLDGALADLAGMKFEPSAGPEEEQVRAAAKGQVNALTAFASAPAGGWKR